MISKTLCGFCKFQNKTKAFFNDLSKKLNVQMKKISDDLEKETCDSLVALWEKQAGQVEALGIDRSLLVAQSLITPSCGAGALSRSQAVRALELTRDISIKIRESRKHS